MRTTTGQQGMQGWGAQIARSVLAAAVLPLGWAGAMHGADQFIKPTAEELSMTSVPGYPGAAAVVLYREELDQDDLGSVTRYERVKILTEEGKKYANVQLRYASLIGGDDFYGFGDQMNAESIAGRTIHADGTIIPFTGKPYLKVIETGKNYKVQERVFTLPDVEVGSIIEYRYAMRSERIYRAPRWYLQGDLYVRSAHYTWYPTLKELVNEEDKPINSIAWFPILPPGAKIDRHEMPTSNSMHGNQQVYDLVVKDIPPVKKEEFMPPLNSYTYRVLFSFTPYHDAQDFWTGEGKNWSKHANAFMNPAALNAATAKITAEAATPDEKLKKIYAAVMALDNTAYTREHGEREDKAAGLGKLSNATDVLEHGRGTPTQLTELFVGMARAAGMKAYLARVPDRSEGLFTPGWLSMDQAESSIAIVVVDGKDRYFDPGERYCEYGRLAWQHTFIQGLRQVEGGTAFVITPGDAPSGNRTTRVANLKLDAQASVSGKIDLTYQGADALKWRQQALENDEQAVRRELTESLQAMVPKSMEVKVTSIDGLTDYGKPLAVHFEASGGLGVPTGKRLMLPVDLFVAGTAATFPHEKRELPVDFRFAHAVQDALRINVDPALTIEAVPDAAKADIPKEAAVYNMTVTQGSNYFVTRRNYAIGSVIVMPDEYAELRTFYSQFEAKDQENVVLKAGAAAASATASAKAPGAQ